MKDAVVIIIAMILFITIITIGYFAINYFKAMTIQSKLTNPKPGIECYTVSTRHGVSVDCWKIVG